MTGKLLQALGVVFVLTLVGGATFGFLVLKDRVRLVVAADEAATGPDATALLRDDVQTLARDVDVLQQALASNFEQLGNALEERANARHAEVLAAAKESATVPPRVAALEQATAQIAVQVQELPARTAAAMAAELAAAASARPAGAVVPDALPVSPAAGGQHPVESAASVDPAPPTPPAVVAVVAPPASSEPMAVAAKPPVKTGFLSFSVPTAAFRFDAPQDYALVSELSRVGFDAKSTLHDFTGVTSQVRGGFHADFDDPQGAWTGEVVVQAASLVTGVDGRDENLREHLDTKNHAEIRFVIARFQPAANGVDVAKQTVHGDIAGTMTIRGQSKPFTMPVAIAVDPQKRVVLTGQQPLKLSDYGVPVPSQLGLINMQDEVVVWIALRARLLPGARK